MNLLATVSIFLLMLLLGVSCRSAPEVQESEQLVRGEFPVEPYSKYGNPPFYKVGGQRYYTRSSGQGYRERGIASWYGSKFHGRRTSSGEIYDMHAMTAAHRTLPLPSYVMVTNLDNGRQVIVRVNDRGPFHSDRIIDLSYAAAVKLGLMQSGTARVEVRAIDPRTGTPYPDSSQEENSLEREFYLQVAAFQDRQRAERLQQQLQTLFDTAVIVNLIQRQQTTFYQVRIGPLSSAEKFDDFTKRLADLGFSDSIVVH